MPMHLRKKQKAQLPKNRSLLPDFITNLEYKHTSGVPHTLIQKLRSQCTSIPTHNRTKTFLLKSYNKLQPSKMPS
jgi:hypothetical protein